MRENHNVLAKEKKVIVMNINFYFINTIRKYYLRCTRKYKDYFRNAFYFHVMKHGKMKTTRGGIKSMKTLNIPCLSSDFRLTSIHSKAKRLSLRSLNSTSMIRTKHVLQSSYSCNCFAFTPPTLAPNTRSCASCSKIIIQLAVKVLLCSLTAFWNSA